MKKYLFIAISLITFTACVSKHDNNSQSLDFSKPELWYQGNQDYTKAADVFYILPTCVFDYTDSSGNMQNYADIFGKEQRAAMLPSYQLAEQIFGKDANFYAPYYRQITLNQWMHGDSLVNEKFTKAMNDINDAFNYFIKNRNNSKPFTIAGFSQGGKAVVELLKQMPDSVYNRMIAAYVIGYKVLPQELKQYPNIKPAESATDIGVTICYNSARNNTAISEIFANNSLYKPNKLEYRRKNSTIKRQHYHKLEQTIQLSVY